jgi:hypothetical protein
MPDQYLNPNKNKAAKMMVVFSVASVFIAAFISVKSNFPHFTCFKRAFQQPAQSSGRLL